MASQPSMNRTEEQSASRSRRRRISSPCGMERIYGKGAGKVVKSKLPSVEVWSCTTAERTAHPARMSGAAKAMDSNSRKRVAGGRFRFKLYRDLLQRPGHV